MPELFAGVGSCEDELKGTAVALGVLEHGVHRAGGAVHAQGGIAGDLDAVGRGLSGWGGRQGDHVGLQLQRVGTMGHQPGDHAARSGQQYQQYNNQDVGLFFHELLLLAVHHVDGEGQGAGVAAAVLDLALVKAQGAGLDGG